MEHRHFQFMTFLILKKHEELLFFFSLLPGYSLGHRIAPYLVLFSSLSLNHLLLQALPVILTHHIYLPYLFISFQGSRTRVHHLLHQLQLNHLLPRKLGLLHHFN